MGDQETNNNMNTKLANWCLIIIQLITPIAVVCMGHYFTTQIEAVNRDYKKMELEVQKIDIAKNFLNELFSGVPERAFIAERLISNVVDDSMKIEIENILCDYYKNEFNKFIDNRDYKKTSEIIQAAKSMNSHAGKKIAKEIDDLQYYIIIASIKDKNEAIEYAKRYERKGYKCNIYFTERNYYAITLGKYTYQQAQNVLNTELEKKTIITTSYIVTGKTFLEQVPF